MPTLPQSGMAGEPNIPLRNGRMAIICRLSSFGRRLALPQIARLTNDPLPDLDLTDRVWCDPYTHVLEGRSPMTTGTVKWFNNQKGFGFIQPDQGSQESSSISARSNVQG